MDLDNCIMGIKFALDAFKDWGGIPDDTKKYVQKVSIVYDNTQPKDTGKIIFSKCWNGFDILTKITTFPMLIN